MSMVGDYTGGGGSPFDSKGFFGNLGGAVADIFRGMGLRKEAKSYGMAATLARENAEFTKESTAVKTYQEDRAVYQGLGTESADVAGAGLKMSGSELDLLKDSASQGALQKAMIEKQGAMTEASFEEQAASYDVMAKSAKQGALGADIGAAIKGVGMILAL
jgi:hypothetical protein